MASGRVEERQANNPGFSRGLCCFPLGDRKKGRIMKRERAAVACRSKSTQPHQPRALQSSHQNLHPGRQTSNVMRWPSGLSALLGRSWPAQAPHWERWPSFFIVDLSADNCFLLFKRYPIYIHRSRKTVSQSQKQTNLPQSPIGPCHRDK